MCNKRSHLSVPTFTLISYVEALNDIKFKDSLFLRVKVFLFYEEMNLYFILLSQFTVI